MEAYIGMIMQVGFNFAPINWAQCLGQTMAIQQNAALFSLLGTSFGGNGTTTFQLPNFQSRFAVGTGQGQGLSTYVVGETGGNEHVTLGLSNLPAHTHVATFTPPTGALQALTGVTATASKQVPAAGSTLCNTSDPLGGGTPQIYAPASTTGTAVNLGGMTLTGGSVTNTMTGNSLPAPTLPPFLAITTNICLYGIFPSRS
jgi:microcystin-dependent protein